MAITRFATPAELPPIDFGFLAQQQQYAQARQDAASKDLDEATGMLAALNPAPGNEEWGKEVLARYNNALGKISEDFGKVDIRQSVSDARRIKADFLSNPEVRTLLNNRDYYDKIISPYMANKEAQFNVPGGTMSAYLEAKPEGGFNFKQNKAAYSGTLSYQPFADVTKFVDDQFKQVEYTLAKDLSNKGFKIETDTNTGLLYYTEGGERKYIRNLDTFAPTIESTTDILMSGQNPESRFLLADARWRGIDPTRDYVKKMISPLATKYFGEKAEGQVNYGLVPKQGDGSGGTGTPTSVSEGVPTIDLGNVPMAIIEDPERQEINATKVSGLKTNSPEYVNNVFTNLQKSNVQLQNWTPETLKISRNYNPKDNQVQYNIGLTEDEFVNAAPANTKDQARQQYRNMQIEFNSEALKEQAQLNLYQKAVDNVNNKIFGAVKKPGDPGYNAESEKTRSQMKNFFNVVENYKSAPENQKRELDKLLYPLLERLSEDLKSTELDEDGEWRYSGTGSYPDANPSDAPSTKTMNSYMDSIEQGVIPPWVKKYLYEEMGKRNPSFKPLETFSKSTKGTGNLDPSTGLPVVENELVEQEYKNLYESDQLKSYKIVSYDLPSTSEKETPYLAKLQQAITKSLKATTTVTSEGKKVMQPGEALDNYVYYTPGSDKIEARSWNSKELFNSTTENRGVNIQGIIYDKESGFWWVGNLESVNGVVGEKVLVRPENHEEFTNNIINNMSLNPGTGETLSSIKVVLQSMPISDLGVDAVRKLDESDARSQKIFNAFGMSNVYISGNDANGYDISFRSKIPGAPVDPETNKLPIQHYNSIADLSAAISKHGQLYNTATGKK